MEIGEDGCFHEVAFVDQNSLIRTTRVPVVQDLVLRGLKNLPERFIQAPPGHPVVAPAAFADDASSATFPPIDMAKLRIRRDLSGESHSQELSKLARVTKEWGVFLIVNHGIPASVLAGVEDVVKGFFGLSFKEKKESVGTYMNPDNMGYGRNFVKSEDQRLDWIDRLAVKVAPAETSDGLLVWPKKPANFRKAIEQYVEEARRVCDELLEALAESLSLEPKVFLKNFDPESSEVNLRVNYFPPCPRPDLALGISPHTDASGLTFLTQYGATGGLQVLRDCKWAVVPWPENSLLVGVGDFLEIMSGRRLMSPWHRVVTRADVERFSVTLFYNPPSQAEIEPVSDDGWSGSNSSGGGYKKVVIRDYLQHYYMVSPTVDKQAINFAKV
ncbi:hypothetical protein U1Q18_035189 [Sarracenia purpurea var. burkii]